MSRHSLACLLLLSTLLLTSCSGDNRWWHPSKSLTDLHIDDKECAKFAQAIAKEQSLVKQPNIYVLQSAYSQCLLSQGWRPTSQQTAQPAETVTITATDNNISFSTLDNKLEVTGQIQLISQDQYGALFKKDEQYIYLNLQHNSPLSFTQSFPALMPGAVLFDQHQTKNIFATFYYQQVDDKLVFGCTAYILPKPNSRIVASITQEVFAMPDNFLTISRGDYDQLSELQSAWTELIHELYDQSLQ